MSMMVMVVMVMSMISLNAQSKAVLELKMSVCHFCDPCVSVESDKDSNLVLLVVWLSQEMEKMIGSGNNLGGFSNNHITGIMDMEDLINVGHVCMDVGACTCRNLSLDTKAAKTSLELNLSSS